MNAHQIDSSGIVVNTIVVDSLDFMPGLIEATSGGIGWRYVNGVFVDDQPATLQPEPKRAPTKEQLMIELAALTAKITALK